MTVIETCLYCGEPVEDEHRWALCFAESHEQVSTHEHVSIPSWQPKAFVHRVCAEELIESLK